MFTFRSGTATDLHYVIGTNGTGKTNLLNAFNWCLYGDEPHLSKDSELLPLMNLKTIENIEVGKNGDVTVEIWAEAEECVSIIFKRCANYLKQDDRNMTHLDTKFEVMYVDEKENSNIVTDEEADVWVERFVPKGIREFFFFDGERLDNYFREATGQNIRHAVFQISQIDLLENCIERKLMDTVDDIRKEAGKTNAKIEEARTKLQQAQDRLIDINKRIEECEKQISISKTKIVEYDDKLKGIPDILNLEEERHQITANIEELKVLYREKEFEKENLLFECGNILRLWPAISKSIRIIEDMRSRQEIPPPIDKEFLEGVLMSKICGVCGIPLDEISSKNVQELLENVKITSENSKRLIQMEKPLARFSEKAKEFEDRMKSLTRDLKSYENNLNIFTQRKQQIDDQLSGYDEDLIREWYSERKKYEEIRDQNMSLLGGLRVMREQAEASVNVSQKELDNELQKDEKFRELRRKLSFCERSLDVVKKTREAIMIDTREKIEVETKKQFFRLIWKKETFGNIQIKPDYTISLIHSMGYECLGSVSAGERELLALSFTLALHQASGFDSPILIDTPVARISDVNRGNFAKVLCEVSMYKQILLLFTPDEFSTDISGYLGGRSSGRYKLKLLSDESEAKVEEL
jgi:DNA sulfur modification protein DndD